MRKAPSISGYAPRYNWNIVESGVKHNNPKPAVGNKECRAEIKLTD